MNEKIYNIKNNNLDFVHFTKEKLFCRIRSNIDDVNVCWISDDAYFNKNVIMFFRHFVKKAKNNNILTVVNDLYELLEKNYTDKELDFIKEIFYKLYTTQDIDQNLTSYELLRKHNEFLYLVLAYFVIEKCPANYLEFGNLIISFKNVKEFVALNFWDKYFK
ncbi:hypothetical protein [Spiroplasma endosymbiont of Aspidapion aeneum]|uniref:hypothetical protein n=1 Tax=Spiroplasma endosymbiont of Aspidapion aeneum TaxID=3066276 RepID=UPI00313AD50E